MAVSRFGWGGTGGKWGESGIFCTCIDMAELEAKLRAEHRGLSKHLAYRGTQSRQR